MKSKAKIVYSRNKQTGSSNSVRDRRSSALPPGKRISKSGNPYYEYRKNRSDLKNRKI